MANHQTPCASCPHCARSLDGATNTWGSKSAPPEPGDLSICGYCGGMLVFSSAGLEPLPDSLFRKLAPDVRRMLTNTRRFVLERRPN